MKKIVFLLTVLLTVTACGNKNTDMAYASFGEKIDMKDVLTSAQIKDEYNNLKVGDTLDVKFTSKINSVCANKGCWMRLDLEDEKEVMVKFKDYGFFMPLDAKGDVIVNGKAFVQETSVDELKHYAEDAGKSAEEIAKITAPKKTLSFVADGVLLKK